MNETILVAGNNVFNENVLQRFSKSKLQFETRDFEEEDQLNHLSQFVDPLRNASIVFISSEPYLFPVAEMALKNSKHVVLFGVQKCSHHQLQQLLELSIESKSMLVNGDSFFFNPLIFPRIHQLRQTEITTLSSNRFKNYISRRSIFNCLELLLFINDSAVKHVSVKAVKLNEKLMNVLHTRLEFENGNLGVLEMSNCKPGSQLQLESAGKGVWLSLDLLSYNGQKHIISQEEKLTPPEQVYVKQRNSMTNLFEFMHKDLPIQVNPHHQFFNSIHTSEVILKMEEQLRRELPNFVRFKDGSK